MASLPTQILNGMFEKYATKEVAFNKSIRSATGLEPKKILLKIRGDQWPCVLYSCSMTSAKIIISLDNEGFDEIKKAKNIVSLKLSFFPRNAKNPVTFFVSSLVKGDNVFKLQQGSSFLMSLEFSQKPPDDLIEIIGTLFQSIENFEKRKELRINLEQKVVSDMGLASANGIVEIDNIKRPCIIRNVSASGCAIILVCNPKFLIEKRSLISMHHIDEEEPIVVEGVIKRSEPIAGRNDIHLLGVLFDQAEKIPFAYKRIINDYIDKLEGLARYKRLAPSEKK